MTKTRYGILAGIAGAALAAWWWRRRTDWVAQGMNDQDRGETIFSNTPFANP